MKYSRFIIVSFIMIFILSTVVLATSAYDGYIVCFKDKNSTSRALEYTERQVSLFSLSEEQSLQSINESLDIYKTYDESLIAEFEQMGLVKFSEPDYICELFDYDYAAEPRYSQQWAHEITGIQYAWDLGIYGNDVTVAVIDSGILKNHQDFTQTNMLDGYNYSTTDTTDTTDNYGHGTSVAGVIASAVNQKGTVGVAHRANIVPIKITDNGKGITVSRITQAIMDAVQVFHADVINLSLGYIGNENSASLQLETTIKFLQDHTGVIVVAAAGNIRQTTANVTAGSTKEQIDAQYNISNYDENGNVIYAYPASFDCVISVANLAKNTSDGTYTYASTSRYNDKVTISAPGNSIYAPYKNSTSSYATLSGTSFSCPYISGVAALAKSVDPDITQQEFETLLIQTANKSVLDESEQRNDHYGYGIVNIEALIKALINKNTKGGFISPVDRTEDGNITVKIHNNTSEEKTVVLLAKTFSSASSKALGLLPIPVKLAAGQTKELSIKALQNSAAAPIKCFLFESSLFKPLYIPVSEY